MELISSIIKNINNNSHGIERINYKFNIDIAKKVWDSIALKFINDIKYDSFNKEVWPELIKYIFADESCKYDINKSIGLIGKTGSGKSKTFEIMQEFISIDDIRYKKDGKLAKFNYKIFSSKNIAGEFSKNGYDAIWKFSNINSLCIDDLGAESDEVKHYGSKVNVIEEIIETRYLNGLFTHFTSNLKPDNILDMYGNRVYSRIMHSVNIIEYNNCDYRLK
jgi:DNA replication protein DnaC